MELDEQRLARGCVEQGLLDQATLDNVRAQLEDCIASGEQGLSLGQMLVELGLLSEQQVAELGRPAARTRVGKTPSGKKPARRSSGGQNAAGAQARRGSRSRPRVRASEQPGSSKTPLIAGMALVGVLLLAAAGYAVLGGDEEDAAAKPAMSGKPQAGSKPSKSSKSVSETYSEMEAKYNKDGDLQAFVAALERLARRQPNKVGIWFRLAGLLLQQRKGVAAMEVYRERIVDNGALRGRSGFGAAAARACYLIGAVRELVVTEGAGSPDDWFYKALDRGEGTRYGRAAAAKLLMYKEEYPEALKALLRVQQKLARRWDVAYSLGQLYAGGLEDTAALKDLDKAIAQFTRALDGAPPIARAAVLAARARVKVEKVDYEGGIADLTGAIADSPKTAAYHCARAEARFRARRFDGAASDAQQALRLDPSFGRASAVLGLIAEKTDKDRAIRLYRKALEDTPTLGLAAERLGCLLLEQGQQRQALALLEQALGASPLADRQRIGRLVEKARKEVEKLPPIDDRPKLESAEEYYERGNKMMEDDQTTFALNDFSSAIKLAPTNALYWATRGVAYMSLDVFDKAEADGRKAIAVDASEYKGYLVLGLTLVRAKKDKPDGLRQLRKALELAPDDAKDRCRRALAWAEAQEG